MHFVKYQGTGNDFILIDNRERKYDAIDVKTLCNPKFGIGADGLMLLQNVEGYYFEMVYYNSDGNISTMCGNGGRCIVAFAGELGLLKSEKVNFLAIDGPHEAVYIQTNNEVFVELRLNDVANIEIFNGDYVLNTGSPHYVKFINDVDVIDIIAEAHQIRYSERFEKEGINVNFVEIVNDHSIKVRTYERGVENETLSCGTGVTACSVALYKHLNFSELQSEISIKTMGGDLKVSYQRTPNQVFQLVTLKGPAVRVFEGVVAG
jgi:diaminopimelate epimerase